MDLDFNQLPEVGGFSRDSVGKESSPLLDQELLIGEKRKKWGHLFWGRTPFRSPKNSERSRWNIWNVGSIFEWMEMMKQLKNKQLLYKWMEMVKHIWGGMIIQNPYHFNDRIFLKNGGEGLRVVSIFQVAVFLPGGWAPIHLQIESVIGSRGKNNEYLQPPLSLILGMVIPPLCNPMEFGSVYFPLPYMWNHGSLDPHTLGEWVPKPTKQKKEHTSSLVFEVSTWQVFSGGHHSGWEEL